MTDFHRYLNNMRNSIKELYKFGEAIVRNATLAAEVMVICWYEPAERQTAVWAVLQQVKHLVTEL